MREYVLLRNGEKVLRVSEEKYKLHERIRNYVLRTNYECGTPMWELKMRAMSLFKVNEHTVNVALYQWRKWCYGAGIRHRPIELFIEDNEKKLEV